MIKVSVIVPVYNGEKHLEECLDSICNQTLKEIEIICVDDGSTDSSWEILNRYKERDDRDTVVPAAESLCRRGEKYRKSACVGRVSGILGLRRFLSFGSAGKIIQQSKKSVNADVCVCGGNQYLESKQKVYPWPPYLSPKKVPADAETFNRFTNPDYYLNFTNAAAWNKIFRRAYIEKLKLDFQPIRNGNDVYFTVNAIGLADRVTILDEKLVNYRVNQDSGLVCSDFKISAFTDSGMDGHCRKSGTARRLWGAKLCKQSNRKHDLYAAEFSGMGCLPAGGRSAKKNTVLKNCIFCRWKMGIITMHGMENA